MRLRGIGTRALGGSLFFESRRSASRLWRTCALCLMLGVALLMAAPFLWTVSTSLKEQLEVFRMPPQLLPQAPRWENYLEGWRSLSFGRYLGNTVFITVVATVGVVASTTLVAFGFARLRAPGREALFVLLLSGLMLPWQVRLIPLFSIFRNLGWVNTILPLIVPEFLATNAFYVFLLRQFMLTIPLELDDAARIVGCNLIHLDARITLPLARSAVGAVVIFSCLYHWNDFFGPLIYLSDEAKWTLPVGLRALTEGSGGETMAQDWPKIMAVNATVMVPCLVLFFAAQRFFVRGVVVTGLKG